MAYQMITEVPANNGDYIYHVVPAQPEEKDDRSMTKGTIKAYVIAI